MRDDKKGSVHRWIACAAACWALIFAVFHIVWAAGWYVLLDAAGAAEAFAVPWKYAYNLVVILMCIVAVPVSLALAFPWGRQLPARLLTSIAAVGIGLLVLRAVASLVQVLYFLITGQLSLRTIGVWEPWFYLGAVLFALNFWWYLSRKKTSIKVTQLDGR